MGSASLSRSVPESISRREAIYIYVVCNIDYPWITLVRVRLSWVVLGVGISPSVTLFSIELRSLGLGS